MDQFDLGTLVGRVNAVEREQVRMQDEVRRTVLEIKQDHVREVGEIWRQIDEQTKIMTAHLAENTMKIDMMKRHSLQIDKLEAIVQKLDGKILAAGAVLSVLLYLARDLIKDFLHK